MLTNCAEEMKPEMEKKEEETKLELKYVATISNANNPFDLTIVDGKLYVADYGNNRIQIYEWKK